MEDLFDWVSPELRAAIDAIYEPEQPWRAFRIPSPDSPTVEELVLPGALIQFKDGRKEMPIKPVVVAKVEAFAYERAYRLAETWGCRYPDGCSVLPGWHILYQFLYTERQIEKLHKKGQRLDFKAGDLMPGIRGMLGPRPFVAIDGRILAMTYGVHPLGSSSDDCEVIILKQPSIQQFSLFHSP